MTAVQELTRSVARNLTGADGASFILRDGNQCFYVDEDAIQPLWKGLRFPMSNCVSGWAMIHRERVVIEDIYADPRVPVDAYRPTFVKSMAMVPIRSSNPVGAIGIYWAKPHRATEDELALLQGLADSVSVAIENIHLVEALEKQVEVATQAENAARGELTERKRAEEALERSESRLRQAQKMDALGQFAGGIAHDFNNILSVILSFSSLILDDDKLDEDARQATIEIEKAGQRAAALTRQILAFSRQQVMAPKILDPGDVASNMEAMVRRLIGAHIHVSVVRHPGTPKVKADAGQLEQVLLNLAANARDAMPNGGKLVIETSAVELDADTSTVPRGSYAMLAVTDSGVGMDKATQARIFEPFYTTKGVGAGTGLGLATVYGIVKQSGGYIWVYSEPGQGTCFKIYFPRAEGAGHANELDARERGPLGTTLQAKGETVLLAEDDDQVRAVAASILRKAGYVVLETANADEALRVARSHSGVIDLLLTDVIMPRISGIELAHKLLREYPQMRALCMSGYTGETILQRDSLDLGAPAFLQKPLTPKALLGKVRELLDDAT